MASSPSSPPDRRVARASRRVTLKDLAARLELSTTTISLVLNRSPLAAAIPAETQERVFAVAEELRYRPNHLARALRSRRSMTVGVLVPEIDEPYAAGILSGLEDHLAAAGYFYLVASHHARGGRIEDYFELLESRSVEGMVLLATHLDQPPRLPTVSVSGHQEVQGVTNVVIDHHRAAELAVGHLRRLGHRRIAFVKGQEGSADTEERWAGIVAAAGASGIELHDELVFQLVDDPSGGLTRTEKSYRDGYEIGTRLVAEERRFTALFSFNDVSAIGATRAFAEAGLRIPEDVSVIGFDDIASAAFHNPGLTTVRQPLREMGRTAAELLLARLAGEATAEATPAVVTLEPELVERATTGPAGGGAGA